MNHILWIRPWENRRDGVTFVILVHIFKAFLYSVYWVVGIPKKTEVQTAYV